MVQVMVRLGAGFGLGIKLERGIRIGLVLACTFRHGSSAVSGDIGIAFKRLAKSSAISLKFNVVIYQVLR